MRTLLLLLIEFLLPFISCFQQTSFKKKLKKRRQYEKENNLPKKLMISPDQRLYIVVGVFIILLILLMPFVTKTGKDTTLEKIVEIKDLLEKEKEVFGKYPKELETIKRGNPMRESLLIDGWNHKFDYQTTNDRNSYVLTSLGKDGKLGTDDDL